MNWNITQQGDLYQYVCKDCGFTLTSGLPDLQVYCGCRQENIPAVHPAVAESHFYQFGLLGPGAFMLMLIQSLDVAPADCQCNMRAHQMDLWGVEGCQEHLDEIVGWLRMEFKRLGWINRLKVRKNAVLNGMVFYINAVNPVPSLVKESIRLAKEYRETHKR